MIKTFKSNKIISLTLIIMCIIILFNPKIYAQSCLNAISVWSINILPLLFPFFIFTRIIVNLSQNSSNPLDKLFEKAYHTPKGSFNTFFLATLSGYPMGAKLVCAMHQNKQINVNQAYKMLSFCSVSGPIFMLGTVGVSILSSYKAGLIILISNIIASLVNGFVYRGKKEETNFKIVTLSIKKENILADSVYDSLISILLVGSYIVLSFLIIDMLNNLNIFKMISNTICGVFNISSHHNVVKSILCGIFEITRGIIDLSATNISLKLKTIISSSMIGFGGFSIFFQSFNFLTTLKISAKKMIVQKLTQAIFCLVITTLLCLLFL